MSEKRKIRERAPLDQCYCIHCGTLQDLERNRPDFGPPPCVRCKQPVVDTLALLAELGVVSSTVRMCGSCGRVNNMLPYCYSCGFRDPV